VSGDEKPSRAGQSLFGDDDDDDDDEQVSSFQRQQQNLQKKISRIEGNMVEGKGWMMRGEASRADRPSDSLLEPDFEFEHAMKAAPVMTTESLGALEDIIKRRIENELWDDVEPKNETLGADRRTSSVTEISQEKSEEGLGELYEKDYREQVMGEARDPEQMSKEELSIEADFKMLCHKLDALANYHFTPKPPKEEVEVRANVAAVAMEEAIPVGMSDGTLLAPEEVYKKHKHIKQDGVGGKAEDELSKEERRARRRAKKKRGMKSSKLNISAKGKEAKKAKARGEPTVTAASAPGESDYSKSSKFFAQLQENKTLGKDSNSKRKKDDTPKLSSSSLKL